jgi:secreted PhoX family phosphatase
MKNTAKSIPKKLTNRAQLLRPDPNAFWADGEIWGCTARGLSEAVAVVDGVKSDEKMQVLIDSQHVDTPEVMRFLEGLNDAQINYAMTLTDGSTMQELFANRA